MVGQCRGEGRGKAGRARDQQRRADATGAVEYEVADLAEDAWPGVGEVVQGGGLRFSDSRLSGGPL